MAKKNTFQKPVLADHKPANRASIPQPPQSEKTQSPIAKESEEKATWAFSFRYWKQIDYFGLDKSQSKWFVALLEKLKELSVEPLDDFLCNSNKRDSYRFHTINWNQKNIPIQRTDLTWIGKDYLSNADEYPLYQFQVSQSLGRVVGFFDEKKAFNIILLDPLHNIQPSKSHGYKIDKSSVEPTELAAVLNCLRKITRKTCKDKKCSLEEELVDITSNTYPAHILITQLSDEIITRINHLISNNHIKSEDEIWEYGILSFETSGQDQ